MFDGEGFISKLEFINMWLFTLYFIFQRKYLILHLNRDQTWSLMSRGLTGRKTHLFPCFPLSSGPSQQEEDLPADVMNLQLLPPVPCEA